MPYTDFNQLPDESKAWVFAANRSLTNDDRETIAREVPNFLAQWTAHGAPVPASYEIRDDRFLVVAADERVAPGGCSIDSLFRFIRALGEHLDVQMLDSGSVWFRDKAGEIRAADRPEFKKLAASGDVHEETPIFDTSLDHLSAYRTAFEIPAQKSWAARML